MTAPVWPTTSLAALHADGDMPAAARELPDILDRARGAADQVLEVLTLDALAALDVRAGNLDAAQRRARRRLIGLPPTPRSCGPVTGSMPNA